MTRASLESQLLGAPCEIEDTEEMFWLSQNDDSQSKVLLGDKRAAQYRFREAVQAYRSAGEISADSMLYMKLGGAYLTLRRFEEALASYHQYISLGGDEKAVCYPMGVWYFLQGEYTRAAECFEKCLPCEDELAVAVIYWHSLASFRAGKAAALLKSYYPSMRVGHHTAYLLAVSVFAEDVSPKAALQQISEETDDLNYIIAAYGLSGYFANMGDCLQAEQLLESLLERRSVWPCISYLAAWGDKNYQTMKGNENQ